MIHIAVKENKEVKMDYYCVDVNCVKQPCTHRKKRNPVIQVDQSTVVVVSYP